MFIKCSKLWLTEPAMCAGVAHANPLLPEARSAKIDSSRGSKLYSKELLDFSGPGRAALSTPLPGKRIGF